MKCCVTKSIIPLIVHLWGVFCFFLGRCRNSVLQAIYTLESDYSDSGALDTMQDAGCVSKTQLTDLLCVCQQIVLMTS